MSAQHTPELQVRIGRPHTYLVRPDELGGYVVRVLTDGGYWRKVSGETVRAAAIRAYRAKVEQQ